MANIWHSAAQAIAFAANKDMIDLFYASGGSRVLRVREIFLFNNQTTPVTGVLTPIQIKTLTTGAPTGGSTITPTKHDSNNSSLNSQVTSGTGRTCTEGVILRQVYYSNEEPAAGAGSIKELECLIPFARIWGEGMADDNIQAFTLRPSNEGIFVKNITTTVGVADAEIVFSDEAT